MSTRSYGFNDDEEYFGQGDYGDNSTWVAFKSDWTPPKVHALSGSGLIDDINPFHKTTAAWRLCITSVLLNLWHK